MYISSNEYKEKILDPTRKFEAKVKIGNITLTNEEVMNFNIEQSIQQDDTFSIGNTISSAFNLVFFHNDVIEVGDKDLIEANLGLKITDENIEYIPLGVYNISNIQTNDTTTSILAYDNMIKFDVAYVENKENPTLYSVINRLEELTKVSFGGNLDDYKNYNLSVLENYSCREVLGFIAGVLGSNALINREGKFKFITISDNSNTSINTDNYLDYSKKNKTYKISRVTNITETEELTIGNNEGMELLINNPYINNDILKDVNTSLNGFEFLPYSVVWSGDITLDLGDLVSVTDRKGNTITHPILTQSVSYNGALSSAISANGETNSSNAYKPTSKEENEIIRNGKKVVQIQKDAGEVYVVVYDDENNSSVRLTEKSLEAIAEEINLSAKNINLEGYITANGNFSIDTKGNMVANNGTFTGKIQGASSINIGDISQDGKNNALRVDNTGTMKIGGNSAYTHTDGVNKGVAEITKLGTIWSCSTTDPYTYTQISEGIITVSNTLYDETNTWAYETKLGNGSISIDEELLIEGSTFSTPNGFGFHFYDTANFNEPVIFENDKGIRCYDTDGTSFSAMYCSTSNQLTFGYGAYNSQSELAYNTTTQYLGGKNVLLRSKGGTYLCCNGASVSGKDGCSINYSVVSNVPTFRSTVATSGTGLANLGSSSNPFKTVYANTVNQTSDRKTKENIEYLNDYDLPNTRASKNSNVSTKDCYDFIKNDCGLATYNYIGDNKQKLNFIANDLLVKGDGTDNKIGQLIVNDINFDDEEDRILTFDTNNYLSVTVGALQQAIKKIEILEKEIEILKNDKGV